jgi:hypothetical protein
MTDDDNVIKLPTKEYEEFRNAIDGRPARNEALHGLLTGDASEGGGTIEVTPEALGFTDIEAAINMRLWLQHACEEKGAKVVGSGYGFGQADLDLVIEGFRYNVSIRPLQQS